MYPQQSILCLFPVFNLSSISVSPDTVKYRGREGNEGVHQENNCQLILGLNLGNWRLLTPTPILGIYVLLAFPTPRSSCKDTDLR